MTSPTLSVGNATGLEHCANDCIEIGDHVIITKTHHSIPSRFEASLPLALVLRATDMAIAIEFDDERMLRAEEVDDVRADRVLPANLQFGGAT